MRCGDHLYVIRFDLDPWFKVIWWKCSISSLLLLGQLRNILGTYRKSCMAITYVCSDLTLTPGIKVSWWKWTISHLLLFPELTNVLGHVGNLVWRSVMSIQIWLWPMGSNSFDGNGIYLMYCCFQRLEMCWEQKGLGPMSFSLRMPSCLSPFKKMECIVILLVQEVLVTQRKSGMKIACAIWRLCGEIMWGVRSGIHPCGREWPDLH